MALTALQQERRKSYIGGSEIAAVMGLDPRKTPFDIWYNKTSGEEKINDRDPVKDLPAYLGTLFEPIVAHIYAIQHPGVALLDTDLFIHPDYSMIGATPDRLVTKLEEVNVDRLLEIKTKNWRTARGFGVPGTDQLPDSILCQVQWQMLATGVRRCDVAVLVDRDKYWEYSVEADDSVHDLMIEKVVPWWNRHVVGGIQPPPQGAKAAQWLRDKFKAHDGVMLQATQTVEEHLERLNLVRENLKALERSKTDLENELKLFIGEREGVAGLKGRVTWKKTKDSIAVDWEAAFKELQSGVAFLKNLPREYEITAAPYVQAMREAFGEVVANQTRTVPGIRRFLFTPPREDV